jgi:hypothetical protein
MRSRYGAEACGKPAAPPVGQGDQAIAQWNTAANEEQGVIGPRPTVQRSSNVTGDRAWSRTRTKTGACLTTDDKSRTLVQTSSRRLLHSCREEADVAVLKSFEPAYLIPVNGERS